MYYTIKSDKSVSHHGPGRVVAVIPTIRDEGPDGVGISINVAGVNGLRLELVVQPNDFDDEASGVQLIRLAERIQLMATAASNRRSSVQMEARGAGGGVL